MSFTWQDLIAWLIVGALSGSLAGMLVKRRKEGFGHLLNLAIGMGGAIIGGVIFSTFGILKQLDAISVSGQDLVAGFVGALILLFVVWIIKKQKGRMAGRKAEGSPRPATEDR